MGGLAVVKLLLPLLQVVPLPLQVPVQALVAPLLALLLGSSVLAVNQLAHPVKPMSVKVQMLWAVLF